MLTALNSAVAANSPGIATTVVDATAFISPISNALAAGIPVVTYNANGATNNPTNGLAYVGQELYVSGQAVGTRLAAAMPSCCDAVTPPAPRGGCMASVTLPWWNPVYPTWATSPPS